MQPTKQFLQCVCCVRPGVEPIVVPPLLESAEAVQDVGDEKVAVLYIPTHMGRHAGPRPPPQYLSPTQPGGCIHVLEISLLIRSSPNFGNTFFEYNYMYMYKHPRWKNCRFCIFVIYILDDVDFPFFPLEVHSRKGESISLRRRYIEIDGWMFFFARSGNWFFFATQTRTVPKNTKKQVPKCDIEYILKKSTGFDRR